MPGTIPTAVTAAIKQLTSKLTARIDKKLDALSPAVSANKLTNPFGVSITGDGSASANIDGSVPVSLSLSLSNTGVTAGAYNNNASQVRPFTVDAKGRITAIGAPVDIAVPWSNVQNKPTTLSGYGITDAMTSLNASFSGLIGIKLPSGATADRVNELARVRYNTTTGRTEGYGAEGWIDLTNVLLSSYDGNVGVVSGTTLIPFDSTAPLVTEGTELWGQSVTPKLANSTNKIRFTGVVDSNTNNRYVIVSIFRDNTLIGWTSVHIATANRPTPIAIEVTDQNTSLTPVRYSCRIGISSAATWYVGRGSTATMGGANRAAWSIDEVTA